MLNKQPSTSPVMLSLLDRLKNPPPFLGFIYVIAIVLFLTNIDHLYKKLNSHFKVLKQVEEIEETLSEQKIQKVNIKSILIANELNRLKTLDSEQNKRFKKILSKLYENNNELINKKNISNYKVRSYYERIYSPNLVQQIIDNKSPFHKLSIGKEFSITSTEDLGHPFIYKVEHCTENGIVEVTLIKYDERRKWKIKKFQDIEVPMNINCDKSREIKVSNEEREYYKGISIYINNDNSNIIAFHGNDESLLDISKLINQSSILEEDTKLLVGDKAKKIIYSKLYSGDTLQDVLNMTSSVPRVLKDMSKDGVFKFEKTKGGYKLYNCGDITEDNKIHEVNIINNDGFKIYSIEEVDKPDNFECKYIDMSKKVTQNSFKSKSGGNFIFKKGVEIPKGIVDIMNKHIQLDKIIRDKSTRRLIPFQSAMAIYSTVYTDKKVAEILKFSMDRRGNHKALDKKKNLYITYNDFTYSKIELWDENKNDNIMHTINCAPEKYTGDDAIRTYFTEFEERDNQWKIKSLYIDNHGDYEGECEPIKQ